MIYPMNTVKKMMMTVLKIQIMKLMTKQAVRHLGVQLREIRIIVSVILNLRCRLTLTMTILKDGDQFYILKRNITIHLIIWKLII